MQVQSTPQIQADSRENRKKSKLADADVVSTVNVDVREEDGESLEKDLVLDVSGQSSDFSLLDNSDENVEGLYVYRNTFNLLPKRVGALPFLRTLKFFGNEINLLPPEFGNLLRLKCLQIKLSTPGFNGFELSRLQGLKELELSNPPSRPSVMTILSDISGLKCLTKLSLCHFSIRYVPPEIGCLDNLEYLDLSFNKIKALPTEITHLTALIYLKVANNKLADLPSGLSSLLKLEILDFSNNRLTSLKGLELQLMHKLQHLNLQYNKLLTCCQIPPWICCNLEGNGKDSSNDEFISSYAEMDVYESIEQNDTPSSCNGSPRPTSSLSTLASSKSRSSSSRRFSKRWKRRYYLQQRARQERLNSSRKWKVDAHIEALSMKMSNDGKSGDVSISTETSQEAASEITGVEDDKEQVLSGPDQGKKLVLGDKDDCITSQKGSCGKSCSTPGFCTASEGECFQYQTSPATRQIEESDKDVESSSESSKSAKCKRNSERDLDNPKPCKSRKPADNNLILSRKYSLVSFCGIDDRLSDGFYDAGRDRPFMTLTSYEHVLPLDSREVILLDREMDEGLDAIALSAQALVSRLKQLNNLGKVKNLVSVSNLQIASLLALFVSDHFGGSEKSFMIQKMRKAASGSNYKKPFVCTCSTGNSDTTTAATKQSFDTVDDVMFSDICDKSLRFIKERKNSVVVPLGTLQFGVCRHRALLFKYLCDRMEPPVPCELVRGYLDFTPHAWNTILVKKNDSWVRTVVDACHPHDIREEADPEYYSRYIPLSRATIPILTDSTPGPGCSFPSLSTSDVIDKTTASGSVFRCKLGSFEAAAKVHTLEVCCSSADEIKNFEYRFLGEVRMLAALKHSCIVKIYGHRISSKWIPSEVENPERRILESAIFMEFVKGGSVKSYLEKLSKAGEKHVPVDSALCIARDVASALVELHSKHIIHRDIKSENILIDLNTERVGEKPLVKLCDFDRAVPLRSSLHTCCIAHRGVPPNDVCVGTPRWMAPEVLQAMQGPNIYGLEVDIWSYGCLLFELLTLQVPYSGLSDLQIHDRIQKGKRPLLTDEMDALISANETVMGQSDPVVEEPKNNNDLETLAFLVELYHRCTERVPTNRPTAEQLHQLFLDHSISTAGDRSKLVSQLV